MAEDRSPGHHMLCDVNGNGLRYEDVTNGMVVKIRAKHTYYSEFEYLYSSFKGKYIKMEKEHKDILYPNMKDLAYQNCNIHCWFNVTGYVFYDKLSNNNKQEWIVTKEGDTILFESAYERGEYLCGKLDYPMFMGGWMLYRGPKDWWKVHSVDK